MATSKIRNYNVCQTNDYFFDTNVWIILFAPIASCKPDKQKQYSSLLQDILSRKAGLAVSSIVLSEYTNRVLRIAFDNWKDATNQPDAQFKRDFRPTQDYLAALRNVKIQIHEILKIATRRPDDFHNISIESVISSMSSTMDYNDAVMVWDCRTHGMCLVSDDRDITSAVLPFTVITAD